ncbi:glycosyl hydrolase [Flavobacterium hauense]
MSINYQKTIISIILLILALVPFGVKAQITAVGSGSYTTTFPGTDSAGRNSFPSGTPKISGNAVGKPVPTNDWWSSLLKENHVSNLFNYPLALRTVNEGLVVSYIVPTSTPNGSSQPIDDVLPIIVGVTGLSASQATVADYSDWTVTMDWTNSTHNFKATAGIGMPFLYFTKNTADVAKVQINEGTVTVSNEMLVVTNSHQGADFAVYAPAGSTWTQNGTTYTSTLNGKNYWSMAFIPPTDTNITTVATEYKKYAYVFPANTTAAWNYNQNTAKLTTTFTVTTDVKEGSYANVLQGLLPHQWGYLASGSPQPTAYSYSSIRGELKTLDGNTFSVENTFKGILPTLPYLDNYSSGFNPAALDSKITQIENDGLATWTDSYNEGQVMNRLIQTARIADEMGDTTARNKIVATIKERLEDWLKAEAGEVAFIFHYNTAWSTLLGYPAGHGQDNNINDHHFHWGYFIHAAAFLEQYQPGWANQWGGMINMLIRDAASPDRNDPLFPYLRNFSPYAGHSWANGFATFPFGNDQESTSESMQFASSLIHWGTITENTTIRDLGIYIYTTEQTATEEYWFDVNNRTFKPGYGFSLASRIWGNGYDNQTFWTSDIAAAYGIEMYPIHGGSLYLGHNKTYVQSLWNEISANTGIMSNTANANLWHDVYWQYLAFINPQAAIDLYDSYPERGLKFGISDAQTYHWLHSMNALGTVNTTITANYPIAASFTKNGEITYVAHNYGDSAIAVVFSDGFTLNVPANKLVTSKDINATGILSSNFYQAYANGSVNLTAAVTGSGVTKVEFFDGTTSLGQDTTAPYGITASNLTLGMHSMYAKVYVGNAFNVTNIISIQVGEQKPYLSIPFVIPGSIQAGNYDIFEGGNGQGISYNDTSNINEGGYRPSEYVDAAMDTQEGPTVGWITAGEWMEYTVNVQTSGLYNLTLRYASGNTNGGGPFHFEVDGTTIGTDITLATTGNWGTWANKAVTNLPLTQGEHVLRLAVSNGEFNLGAMNFTYSTPLAYVPPIADAGANVSVVLPATTATLNGSASNDPGGQPITYSWEQVYGPSVITFGSNTVASPNISNLAEGIYKCKLTVSDGTYTATDYVLIIVSLNGNSSPAVSITSPQNNASYVQGAAVTINAAASDLDGTVTQVEFFDGTVSLGVDTTQPYSYNWTSPAVGTHTITAVATDNGGAHSTSQPVTVVVSGIMQCIETSNTAQQGSFSTGYEVTFETVGNNVIINFEMLDTDKVGVVAFLWQQSPFSEVQMDNVSGLNFSKTISGLTPGTTISYACKFAYAGGMSVTQYMTYIVGQNCNGSSGDTQAPTAFTASLGTVTATSVELLLNATDDSGTITYNISYGTNTTSTTGISGVQKSLVINSLTPSTAYTFSIAASDAAGNNAANNSILVQATTLETGNTTTECAGSDTETQQGTFSTGYEYAFETSGTDVTITFEMLDTDKVGVVAYLWQETPFSEVQMDNTSGLAFSKTITGQVAGTTISYACKFAYAGGMTVTKYISYSVGQNCDDEDTEAPSAFTAALGAVTSSSVELLLNASDNSGTVTYTITYNGNIVSATGVSGEQKTVIIPGLMPETTYSFSIAASDASGNTAINNDIIIEAITSEVDLGIDDPEFDNLVTLYPNPANSTVHINSKLYVISGIEVYSLLGAKIIESYDVDTINIENLQSGIYLVKIHSESRTVIKKLIVKK